MLFCFPEVLKEKDYNKLFQLINTAILFVEQFLYACWEKNFVAYLQECCSAHNHKQVQHLYRQL